jgi:hypothetical protein
MSEHTLSGYTELCRVRKNPPGKDWLCCIGRQFPKLPNKPLERVYPTFLSNLSSHSLMPASCSVSAS